MNLKNLAEISKERVNGLFWEIATLSIIDIRENRQNHCLIDFSDLVMVKVAKTDAATELIYNFLNLRSS
jgi:hypothetical protein